MGFGNNGLAKANLHGANDQKVLAGGDRESVGAGFTDSGDLLESEAFSTQKEKVLIAKKDNYLLDHDINDILNATSSLDENLDRFNFVFFIGYESSHLECNAKEMAGDYEDNLKSEVKIQFKSLVDKMISKDEFYKDLHVEVYLYPIPSLDTLIKEIQNQVEAKWKIA